jgi:hypothetical protein
LLGLSASTGQLSDNHDVISLKSFTDVKVRHWDDDDEDDDDNDDDDDDDDDDDNNNDDDDNDR